MNNEEMEQKLRNEAKTLIEQGKVDYIIGYEQGSLKFTTTPLITKNSGDVERLVINSFIVNNLADFLTKIDKCRVGIVVKGCDSRSIVSLIQDNKAIREDLVIIAVPCQGLIDLKKIERLVGKDRDEIDAATREDSKIKVTAGKEEKEFSTKEVLYDNCLACEMPTPKEYDILLGEPTSSIREGSVSHTGIDQLKEKTSQQRWEYWKEQFERCTRCYACRNICPACFCERCFVDESEPQWLVPVPRWQENLMFQVIRNIHVAGRCTDCGGCERACPVNIPLRSLTREMYDIVDELFKYEAGMDKDKPSLMAHYEQEDTEEFIR